ncbi:MAG: CBS domain-containing protein [Bacteroidota bacterium]
MLAKDLISDNITTLKTSDSAKTALSLMEELRVYHLPIVNNELFLGLISEDDIYEFNKLEEPIGSHNLSLTKPYVIVSQHIFDVIRIVHEHSLSLVPVLGHKNEYLGCITLPDLVKKFVNITSVNHPGGIIILEINTHDYSLSEISRIVESNDAKVLSSYLTSYEDTNKLEVTIKVNKIDISGIIQTFNRYDYIIKSFYSEENRYDDLLDDRFQSLLRYLDI